MNLLLQLAFAISCSQAFSPSTVAIWGPSDWSATHVFLRPTTYVSPSSVTRATVLVSAGPGNPKLLGAYRLFVNGLDLAVGPGRGDVPTGATSLQGNAVYDTVEVPSSVLAAAPGQLSVAMQCSGGGWAMLELRAYNAANNVVLNITTTDPTWRVYNADSIFWPGIPDTCGRVNEDIDAGAFSHVAQWRDPSYTPDYTWRVPQVVTPSVLPVAKTTLPLRTEVGLQPTVLTQLSPLHWFFDFGVERMAGVSLVADNVAQGTLLSDSRHPVRAALCAEHCDVPTE